MFLVRLIASPVILAAYLLFTVLMVVAGTLMWIGTGTARIILTLPIWR